MEYISENVEEDADIHIVIVICLLTKTVDHLYLKRRHRVVEKDVSQRLFQLSLSEYQSF